MNNAVDLCGPVKKVQIEHLSGDHAIAHAEVFPIGGGHEGQAEANAG